MERCLEDEEEMNVKGRCDVFVKVLGVVEAGVGRVVAK